MIANEIKLFIYSMSKHPLPINVREFESWIDPKEIQLEKQHSSMDWTVFGIWIDDSDEQWEKHSFSMDRTEFGIVIDCNDEQLKNIFL